MAPAAAVGATNASLSTEPPLAAESVSLPLPKGTTVLHIGDSFAGALGIELNREFKDAGVRGILKYETATYIPTWAWGKDLEKYLSKYHPDLVLITLGANELEIPDPAQRAPTIRHLVERLAGRPCVWVAPPLWRGARPALLDVIRESCAPCAYLDSSELVPELPRAKDGIHPAMAARKEWAKAVIKWLGEHRRSDEALPWKLE
jgi:lysophospholipase L1-like esterase